MSTGPVPQQYNCCDKFISLRGLKELSLYIYLLFEPFWNLDIEGNRYSHHLQVAQTSALADRKVEERKIFDLETAVNNVSPLISDGLCY